MPSEANEKIATSSVHSNMDTFLHANDEVFIHIFTETLKAVPGYGTTSTYTFAFTNVSVVLPYFNETPRSLCRIL